MQEKHASLTSHLPITAITDFSGSVELRSRPVGGWFLWEYLKLEYFEGLVSGQAMSLEGHIHDLSYTPLTINQQ